MVLVTGVPDCCRSWQPPQDRPTRRAARPAQCHDDSPGLSPRAARARTEQLTVGSDWFRPGVCTCASSQTRGAEPTSLNCRGNSRAPPSEECRPTLGPMCLSPNRNIQHTVKYTELAAERFQGFWRDED